jgi:hypothetical protein
MWGVATLAMAAAMASTLHATIGIVPEIDDGSMVTAMALLSGAVLIVRARMRRR